MHPMISNKQYWADRAMHSFRYSLALVGILMTSSASAQQPPADPRMDTYRQLLSEANDRVVQVSAQAQHLQQQVQTLTKQLEASKEPKKEPGK